MPLSSVQMVFGLLFLVYVLYIKRRKRAYPLPPGPKGWPIIGNAFDIPLEGMAPTYAAWAKRFNSDIISASALGTTVIVIDSYDAAVELLDKRATKYSSRPTSVMAGELMGFDSIFVLSPYSDGWRERRKLFARHFRVPASSDKTGVPEAYEFVNRFLVDLHHAPEELHALTRYMVGSLAISLAYGLPLEGRHDPLLKMIESIARMVAEEVIPGKALVDILPWLKYIPEWLPGHGMEWIPTPGMGFKRFAKSVRWLSVKFKVEPYQRAVDAFGTEGVCPSFLSESLATLDAEGILDEQERSKRLDAIQDAAATVFGTAADTTVTAILTFLFAIAVRPEIRARIQRELESHLADYDGTLVGKRTLRLPTFEDQDKLPVLMAALMESQRWAPVTPIGVPHMATEDDVYNGFFIPKGSVVIANQWSMLNDVEMYGPDALDFNPDRFLRPKLSGDPGVEFIPDVRHPNTAAFGFGRRVCPGSHIAQSVLWLTAARLLTLFDLKAPPSVQKVNYVNAEGKVDEHFDPGFFCFPKKFPCEFELRSEEARSLMGELKFIVPPNP